MRRQERNDAVVPGVAPPEEGFALQELGRISGPGEPVGEEAVRRHKNQQRQRDIGKDDENEAVQHEYTSLQSAAHNTRAASANAFQGESVRSAKAVQMRSIPGNTFAAINACRPPSPCSRAR